jgi:hypothetical protein
MNGVHVPWMLPGGATQGMPEQQSAFAVQDWPDIWQEVVLHWSTPVGPATHGLPLQHSSAAEQPFPAVMQPTPPSPFPFPVTPVYALQRGTPNGSRVHASNLGFWGPQQSDRVAEFPQV